MDHADDCLICSTERKAAMRSFGPAADRGPSCSAIGPKRGFAMMSNLGADVGSTAQYFCQEARTDEKRRARRLVSHWKPTTPATLGCSQGNFTGRHQCEQFHQAAALLVQRKRHRPGCHGTYRYDGSETFSFKLDKAMAIIVEDDKTNEIAIDTWFTPYTKHK
jgi:hypothetical protein